MQIRGAGILAIYAISLLLLTFPLILNLDSVLLPQAYPDIAHSDIVQHSEKIAEYREGLAEEGFHVIIDNDDVSQPYLVLGLALTGLGLSGIAAFNLHYLLVVLLTAFFTFLYVREFVKNDFAGLYAGLAVIASPYLHYAYYWGHSNTVSVLWVPLMLFFFERWLTSRRHRYAFALGAATFMQLISSSYTFAFATVFMSIYVLWRLWQEEPGWIRNPKMWKSIGTVIMTFAVLSAPYLALRTQIEPIPRTLEENTRDYWRLDSVGEVLHPDGHLYLGLLNVLLAAGFIAYLLWKKRRQELRKQGPHIALAILGLLIMIGPIAWYLPYYWLFHVWPYFEYMRVPFRSYIFGFLSLVTLAAGAIAQTEKRLLPTNRIWAWRAALIILLIAMHVIASSWLWNLHLYEPTAADLANAVMN